MHMAIYNKTMLPCRGARIEQKWLDEWDFDPYNHQISTNWAVVGRRWRSFILAEATTIRSHTAEQWRSSRLASDSSHHMSTSRWFNAKQNGRSIEGDSTKDWWGDQSLCSGRIADTTWAEILKIPNKGTIHKIQQALGLSNNYYTFYESDSDLFSQT